MDRFLKRALAVLPLLSLAGCWHPRHYTSIDNQTGYLIQVIVVAKSRPDAMYGPLEPGNSLHLTNKIDDLVSISYSYGNRGCRMDHAAMIKAAHPELGGYQGIGLRPCGSPTD